MATSESGMVALNLASVAATAANGQPAAAAYLRGPDGVHRAFGIAVLTATATGISRIVVFGDPGEVTRFGFPQVWPED